MQSGAALMGYGVGLLGIVAVKVLAPGFYARQDVRTPVRIAIAVLVMTQAFNLLLVPWLAHAALTLSIGLGALVNAGWLLRGLRRLGVYRPRDGWGAFVLRIVIANLAMGALLYALAQRVDWIGLQSHLLGRAGAMAGALLAAAAVYFGVLSVSGLRWREFLRKT